MDKLDKSEKKNETEKSEKDLVSFVNQKRSLNADSMYNVEKVRQTNASE